LVNASKPPINKNASNSRLGSVQSRRFNLNRNDEENKSDWGTNLELGGGGSKLMGVTKNGQFGLTDNVGSGTNRNR